MKLVDNTRLLFEVESLMNASPATISRCGMLFIGNNVLKWQGVIDRWVTNLRIDKLGVPIQ